jgi:hypothetical protein
MTCLLISLFLNMAQHAPLKEPYININFLVIKYNTLSVKKEKLVVPCNCMVRIKKDEKVFFAFKNDSTRLFTGECQEKDHHILYRKGKIKKEVYYYAGTNHIESVYLRHEKNVFGKGKSLSFGYYFDGRKKWKQTSVNRGKICRGKKWDELGKKTRYDCRIINH